VSVVSERRVILPCNRGYVVFQFGWTIFQWNVFHLRRRSSVWRYLYGANPWVGL